MASQRLTLIIFLLSLFKLSSSSLNNAAGITVYWGQNSEESDLLSTCETGNYKIVILAFLNQFGGGKTPAWDFGGHCDKGSGKKCTELESQIKYCQKKRIKVFLSIGGNLGNSDYSLNSPEEAKEVAKYIFNNFLSGKYGPLGSVKLDGIDFFIQKTEDYWDNLVKELDSLRPTISHPFSLSAAPSCLTYPIPFLGKAIATKLFDYVFVRFYDKSSCSYVSGTNALLDSWDKWVDLVASPNLLFVGLPASPDAGEGYIPPEILIGEVLPYAKLASNYGGVMLWDRYRDAKTRYSDKILFDVTKSNVPVSEALSDKIYLCVSKALNRGLDY
ncbi:acidic endochitinase-like [Vigna radiata var. radiata]|uniref:Acidic endochitinase-like n=1 Tax=Vigna radiata var. radiata TaxID=3916 RepID=A0A1S3TG11_VIGRR|nr:acidic endochitinase-like [Vigna radiata var. radiata]XP_014492677.1 acidic endochitinase-like [Vigna radiata var. radiata]